MTQPRILVLSDSAYGTSGFSTVSLNVCKILANLGYRVFNAGIGYAGNPVSNQWFTIFPAGPPTPDNQHGYFTFEHYIRKLKPDVLLSICDLQYIKYIPEKKPKDLPWVAYFPVDTHDWIKEWFDIARKPNYLIPYSKFAYNLMKVNRIKPYDMIYHGVDPEVFFPMDKKEVREKYFPNMDKDTFVVGTVATLNPRKMWGVWFEVVDKFLKDKDDAIVIALCDPRVKVHGWYPFNETRISKGLENKVITPADYNFYAGGYTPPEINIYYNLFDCHLLTTGGEGFGLPILESMAAGCPNIATDYTACPEIIDDAGFLIPIKKFVRLKRTERPIADVDAAVDYLNLLYEDKKLKEKLSKKAYERSKMFHWKNTEHQWRRVMEDALSGKK